MDECYLETIGSHAYHVSHRGCTLLL